MVRHAALLFSASILCAAQAPPEVSLPPLAQASAPAPPSAEALGLARALVAKTASGNIADLPWLGMPMGNFMHELHITPREHARTVFREALVPVLQKHIAEFHEIEAETYAGEMSLDDLKAVNAFFDSPAGLALLHMHEPLLKMNMTAVLQLLEKLKPEIQAKTKE